MAHPNGSAPLEEVSDVEEREPAEIGVGGVEHRHPVMAQKRSQRRVGDEIAPDGATVDGSQKILPVALAFAEKPDSRERQQLLDAPNSLGRRQRHAEEDGWVTMRTEPMRVEQARQKRSRSRTRSRRNALAFSK
jgi:hypothetical protein